MGLQHERYSATTTMNDGRLDLAVARWLHLSTKDIQTNHDLVADLIRIAEELSHR
jgi:hypothetical protein